jgi:hypothetical protein
VRLLRIVALALALLVGMVLALAFVPASRFAPLLASASRDAVSLTAARGTLINGEGVLNIALLNTQLPIRWQPQGLLSLAVALGGGMVLATPTTISVTEPVALPARHAMATGTLEIQDLQLRRQDQQWLAHGRARVPALQVHVNDIRAAFSNIEADVSADGALRVKGGGDAAIDITGQLKRLAPLSIDISGRLTANETRNPALANALRRGLPAHPQGGAAITWKTP